MLRSGPGSEPPQLHACQDTSDLHLQLTVKGVSFLFSFLFSVKCLFSLITDRYQKGGVSAQFLRNITEMSTVRAMDIFV